MASDGDVLPTGHTVELMKGEEAERLIKNYYCYTDGVMRLQPGGWVLPTGFKKSAHLVHSFEYKKDDTLVVSYPKSGTTWAQEIVWCLVKNPNLDNPDSLVPLDIKFPSFESDMYLATTGTAQPSEDSKIVKLFRKVLPGEDISGICIKMAAFAPEPRLFKAHRSVGLFPKHVLETSKMIYVAREIRDVVYSLYYYMRLQILWGYRGTLDQFVDDVVSDRIIYGPYFEHLKEAWDLRNHPNFLFIFYEDMKVDIDKEIRKIDNFIGTNRNDQQIKNVIEYTDFSAMKERTKDNPPTSNGGQYYNKDVAKEEGGFFRKGVIGDWKNRFTDEQVAKLNSWAERNLKQFGPDFKYNKR